LILDLFPALDQMDARTTIWLIRHGLTDGADDRCCGCYNVRLSTDGIIQAKAIAARLARESISNFYSSYLSRAIETAGIVVEPHGLPFQKLEELAEMNFGDLEGLRYEEIQQRYPEIFQSWMTRPTETRFPNGESFTEMKARVLGALDLLLFRHRNQSIAIVTHAGVIRLILAQALCIPDNQIFRLAQGHGAINRIEYFDDGPVVQLMNG
jgi:broad specificity phosphatase PhoE